MEKSWVLDVLPHESQSMDHLSFIGGRPLIPRLLIIPNCSLCNSQLTFMFQVAFPIGHEWQGKSLAVFFCTSCADENHLIPTMLDGSLKGVDIPKQFLTDYQKNFYFSAFPSDEGRIRKEYIEKAKFYPLQLNPTRDLNFLGTKVGGNPTWLLENEAPGSYSKKVSMRFLMQLQANTQFEIVQNAPNQIELDLFGEQAPSPFNYYNLFNGNAVYFFGTNIDECECELLVYAITQVD